MTNLKNARTERDPAARTGEPRHIVADAQLSKVDKVKILLDWRQDLIELQNASTENMPDQTGEADVGARLQAVTDALIELGYESS